MPEPVTLTDAEQAAVDAAVQRRLAEIQAPPAGGDGQRGTVPALNANAGQPQGEPAVAVRVDHSANWRRRAARFFIGKIRAASDDPYVRRQGEEMLEELTVRTLDLTEAQYRAELAEAREVLSARVLDLRARHRTAAVLESYDEALTALRSVPASERRAASPLSPQGPSVGQRTMSTLSDAAGGYLVPTPMLAELLVFIEEYGYVRSLFRNVTMTADTLEWKKIGTKPVAAWYGELERIAPSDMTFGTGGLSSAKLAGITSWSRELEEDTMVALLPVYTQLMGEAMAEKEDLAGIKGDGSASYGGFRGVLDLAGAGEATVHTMASGNDGFTDFDYEEAVAATKAVSKARRKNAKWLLPESVVTALVTLKRNGEANNYVTLDPNTDVGVARLLGYPLVDPEGIEDDFFPADAASTVFGAFGDFSRSIFGIRRGFTVETSREGVLNDAAGAVTLNALQQDAVLAKVTERVAIGHPQPDAYVLLKTAAN